MINAYEHVFPHFKRKAGYEWEVYGLEGLLYKLFTSYHEARESYEWFAQFGHVTLHCIYSDVYFSLNLSED